MPSESLVLDPAIRELLLDIARDKDSTLMRVPRANLARYAATGIRAGATALSSAERHLMQTHRIEVALALRNLCRARLWEHPQARLHVMRPITRTTFFEVPEQATSVARGLRALEPIQTLDEATGVADLLEACIQPPGTRGPSTTQLAAASLRLEPTDQARIYCAIDSMYDGDPDRALHVLHAVLGSRPSRDLEAYALTSTGCIEATLAKWQTALDAYKRASELHPSRAMPLMSALIVSGFLSDFALGQALAGNIDDQYSENHPAVSSFSILLGEWISSQPATWTKAEVSFFGKLARESGNTCRRILHEIYA